eukprot:TRINITY_DN5771_c0_g1_i1.p3 TRINITY_DN5771_c0_g1~~TRINITY_DN5771_c0_g1_i1.p3  ORF type:complete len:139 (-),score=25.65 TRINITY_DN5771_c0_g1_i1:138-554(-)
MEAKFFINKIVLSNPEEREILWDSKQLDWNVDGELEASIPAKILQQKCFAIELNFSSVNAIKQLRLEKHVYVNDQLAEFFEFKFGFVIPGSTNSWQQIIFSAENMIPKEVLSGNLVVDAKFFDDEQFLCEKKVRIYYV